LQNVSVGHYNGEDAERNDEGAVKWWKIHGCDRECKNSAAAVAATTEAGERRRNGEQSKINAGNVG
jgi:hypothetical protein